MNNTDYDYPDVMEIIHNIEQLEITDVIYEFGLCGIKLSGINTPGGRQFAIHQTFMNQQGSGQYFLNKDDVYLEVCILLEKELYKKDNKRDYYPSKWKRKFFHFDVPSSNM